MKFTAMNNQEPVIFSDCPTHKEIRFVGPCCPVCQAIESRDKALADRDEEIAELKGVVDDLADQCDSYRKELRL